MRYFLLTLFAACAITSMADDYNYLEVEQSNGTTLDVALTNLRKITFTGEEMVIEGFDGHAYTLPLANLNKLYFSAFAVPVVGVKADSEAVVGIYTLDGRRLLGIRPDQLPSGVYIVRKADGSTVKIARQ